MHILFFQSTKLYDDRRHAYPNLSRVSPFRNELWGLTFLRLFAFVTHKLFTLSPDCFLRKHISSF